MLVRSPLAPYIGASMSGLEYSVSVFVCTKYKVFYKDEDVILDDFINYLRYTFN